MATSSVQLRDGRIYDAFSKAYITNDSTRATNVHSTSSGLEMGESHTLRMRAWICVTLLELQFEFHLDTDTYAIEYHNYHNQGIHNCIKT